MRPRIHREGKKILLSLFALMAAINIVTFQVVQSQAVFLFVLCVTVTAYILISTFFRNPRRRANALRKHRFFLRWTAKW